MNNSDGKKYNCAVCEYATNDWSRLVKHERVHTGEKPFKCDQCNFACSQNSHLTRHKRTHTGERPFKCDQCNLAFVESGALTKHKRTHTGEKPYKCAQCTSAFVQSSALTTHKRRHTREKPYKCDECPYACAYISNLIKHKRKHTKKKKPQVDALIPPVKGIKTCSVQLRRLSVERIHSLTKRTSSNDAMIKREPPQDPTDNQPDSSEGQPCVKVEMSNIKEEPLDYMDDVPVSTVVKRDYAECRDVDWSNIKSEAAN